MENLLSDIGLIIIFSSILGVIGFYFRQPLIIAYITAGILLGPFGFGVISDPEFIHIVAEIGIILMLFLVGIEMNLSRLKELGLVAIIAGIGEVVVLGGVGFLISIVFGLSIIESVYIGIALAFSSTVIAVKLLSDKHNTNTLYGQICLGILIVQDILAVLVLMILAGFQSGGVESFQLWDFGEILLKGFGMVVVAILLSNKVLKYLYSSIAKSHELLILFSLSWCFVWSMCATKIGFSPDIGAFIAGMSLANLPYTFEINMKTRILRDFFITIFFASLGAGLIFSYNINFLLAIVLSLFVLIGTPLIILFLMGRRGYDKKTALFTGLALANISEFSIIIVILGGQVGHLNQEIVSLVTMVGIITMVLSSYMMTYNKQIYKYVKNWISIFESKHRLSKKEKRKNLSDHIILFGCGKMGNQVLEEILTVKNNYIVVDHDHSVIKKLMQKGIHCLFGDVEDEEMLEELDFDTAEIVISTLPDNDDNYFLLHFFDSIEKSKRPVFIVFANSAKEGMELYSRGADYVVLNTYLGAQHIKKLNKEIYAIKESVEKTLSDPKDFIISDKNKKIKKDEHEIAVILHQMNEMNLKKIKNKIRNR